MHQAEQCGAGTPQRQVNVDFVERGNSTPVDYQKGGRQPPTPRQLLSEHGVEGAMEIASNLEDLKPAPAVFENSMLLGSTIFELANRGKVKESKLLFQLASKLNPKVLSSIRFLGDFSVALGRKEDGIAFYQFLMN